MDTTGLEKLNKQGSYLTTLEKEDNQNQWINILRNKPTEAINAYHNALCSNGKNKGYCDLLDLFRIMGALEQVKDGKLSLNELNNQHSKELTAIKDDMKELKQSMKSFAPESESKLQEEINELKSQHQEEKEELKSQHQEEKAQLQDKINIQDNTNKEDLRKINEAILKLKQNIESISPEGLNLNKLKEALSQLNIIKN
jgi:chromosome segregation ATPase